jgi:hypothetical protein
MPDEHKKAIIHWPTLKDLLSGPNKDSALLYENRINKTLVMHLAVYLTDKYVEKIAKWVPVEALYLYKVFQKDCL